MRPINRPFAFFAIVVIVTGLLWVRQFFAFLPQPDQPVSGPLCGAWQTTLSPGTAESVAALAPNDVWFAGLGGNLFGKATIHLTHWDGNQFHEIDGPVVDADQTYIQKMAANAGEIWAVGTIQQGEQYRLLALHWDGQTWQQMSAPALPSSTRKDASPPRLKSILPIAANDGWAAGYYDNGEADRTLALHWDGQQWSIVPTPNATVHSNELTSLIAPDGDLWAIGSAQNGGHEWQRQTLGLHWNGKAWTQIDYQLPGIGEALLALTLPEGETWALGWQASDMLLPRSATLKPASSTWIPQSLPKADLATLSAVAASAGDDVWAVGYKWSGYPPNLTDDQIGARSLIYHWDGTTWAEIPGPNPAPIQSLYDIALAGPHNVWAVGTSAPDEDSLTRSMIAHFVPCS